MSKMGPTKNVTLVKPPIKLTYVFLFTKKKTQEENNDVDLLLKLLHYLGSKTDYKIPKKSKIKKKCFMKPRM